MTLSPQFLDELRHRTTLSALIGRTVKLQRAGREHKGCCPFHQEKTPSFYVNDDKGFYHCFGCSAHGDAIRFLTDAQGLPFMDAVKELAAAAGLDLPAPDPRAAEKAERQSGLVSANEAAARWFAEQLAGIEGAAARDYLKRRGVPDALGRAFGLGFAPDGRGRLRAALARYGDAALVEAGLLIHVDDKEPYDRFRGRLMIPIRDPRGRVIAFGGRILGEGEPKYLNSPETPLFDKGRTLFNLDRAAPAARKAGRLIVVEGYMDVVALARAGIDEAVAPLGTALTEAQIERLWRIADVPVLCLDGDAAGRKAALRAAHRALPLVGPGRSLAFAALPDGQDPDDLVRAGGREAVEAALASPRPLVDLLWEAEIAAAPLATPEARAGLRARLAEQARGIADPGTREQYRAEFRRRFDGLFASPPIGERRRDLPGRRGGAAPFRPATAGARAIGRGGIDATLARAVVAGLLLHPRALAEHAEAVHALPLADPVASRVRDVLVDAACAGHALETAGLRDILTEAGLAQMADGLTGLSGLAFSFMRVDAEPDRAVRDLGEVIEVLTAGPALERALTEVTRAFEGDVGEAAFAEQQRLAMERQAAERRLIGLMQPDGDGGR